MDFRLFTDAVYHTCLVCHYDYKCPLPHHLVRETGDREGLDNDPVLEVVDCQHNKIPYIHVLEKESHYRSFIRRREITSFFYCSNDCLRTYLIFAKSFKV